VERTVRDATISTSPRAIQACVASLAAEAFDLGHPMAARVLAQAAAMLSQPQYWQGTPAE